MERRIAARYARALFAAARKEDVVGPVGDDLESIRTLLTHDEALRRFMLSPNVGRGEKLRLIEKVFADRVTALTMSAFRLLLEKRREDLFESMVAEYVELRREYENVLHCRIVSASPMTDAERDQVLERLAHKTGKTIEAEFDLDPKLIGGVQVKYGDYILDGTLRGGIDRLRERLQYDLLKRS